MPVGEMLARMSSRELAEWREYYALGADDQVIADLKAQALSRLERRQAVAALDRKRRR